MREIPTWQVECYVSGPLKVSTPIKLREQKGINLDDPFYSDIEITNTTSGVKVTVTAFASTDELARRAGLFFVGQMLDVLTFSLNQPINLSLQKGPKFTQNEFDVQRIIEKIEWSNSFKISRQLSFDEPTFLRAIGWYRKGLCTEDPLDKFLAFWNSIEIVANKYHPPLQPGRAKGAKNFIWACFIELWGNCTQWPVIPGETNWIDENYDKRVEIAHGTSSVDIEQVERVLNMITRIKPLAYGFLQQWAARKMIRPLNLAVIRQEQ